VVQCLISAFSRSDGYIQIVLDFVLTDEVVEAVGSEVGVKRRVFGVWFP
jgi:hypothetical protein